MPRILVIRFSSIGDIVLTSPVLRCLKLQLDAEVHFLTKASFASVLVANPYIDKIHTIKKDIKEVQQDLKEAQFDYIIDLHKNLRSLRVRLMLGIPVMAFQKLNFKKWLLVNFKIDKMPAIHIVDRYLSTVSPLGIHNDGQGLDYFIPENTQLPELVPTAPFIALVIGAAHSTKRLPNHKLIELCQQIKRPIILLGGPDDVAASKVITSKGGKHIINACGKCSLHQSALIAKKSSLVITHDTGMMHIAAALRKPIISVWGNTVPKFGMTPYLIDNQLLNELVQVKDLNCRPCSKIGHAQCPKGHFKCMTDIDLGQIKGLVESIF